MISVQIICYLRSYYLDKFLLLHDYHIVDNRNGVSIPSPNLQSHTLLTQNETLHNSIYPSIPRNPAAFTGAFFIALSFFLTIISNHTCNYIVLDLYEAPTDTNSNLTFKRFTRGIWQGEIENNTILSTCTQYTHQQYFDPKWKTSRAFSVISDMFAVLTLIPGLSLPFQSYKQENMRAVGSLCMKTCVFQGLTLLLLSSNACDTEVEGFSEVACRKSTGAKCAIAAVVFWFASGVIVMVTPDSLSEGGEEEASSA